MTPAPSSFLDHLRTAGYHPRSNKHSNALASAIVSDLAIHCSLIGHLSERGERVYKLNYKLMAGKRGKNVDLVIGRPSLDAVKSRAGIGSFQCKSPSKIEIAIELKSIMTEHHKNAKNRKSDLEGHHVHVRRYDRDAISAGVFVVNGSRRFQSPLRAETNVHLDHKELVTHCINEIREISLRESTSESGLDALCIIVVDHDNVDLSRSKYFVSGPAPQVGDPMHYDAFIQTICRLYAKRFGE